MSPAAPQAAPRRVIVLRHGETDHNAARIWQGHLDTPLSDRGIAQADAVGPAIAALSPDRIVETVARYYGVPSDQLRGKARDKQVVLPRQIAMYLMREETEAPLMRIGEALGGRDHSTVLHGCEKIEREMAENDDFRRDVGALREMLYTE